MSELPGEVVHGHELQTVGRSGAFVAVVVAEFITRRGFDFFEAGEFKADTPDSSGGGAIEEVEELGAFDPKADKKPLDHGDGVAQAHDGASCVGGHTVVELVLAIDLAVIADLTFGADHKGIDEARTLLGEGELFADIGRGFRGHLGFESGLHAVIAAPANGSSDREEGVGVEDAEVDAEGGRVVIHEGEGGEADGVEGDLLAEEDLQVLVDFPGSAKADEVAVESEVSEGIEVVGMAVLDDDIPLVVDRPGVLEIDEVFFVIEGLGGEGVEAEGFGTVVLELDLVFFEEGDLGGEAAFDRALFGGLSGREEVLIAEREVAHRDEADVFPLEDIAYVGVEAEGKGIAFEGGEATGSAGGAGGLGGDRFGDLKSGVEALEGVEGQTTVVAEEALGVEGVAAGVLGLEVGVLVPTEFEIGTVELVGSDRRVGAAFVDEVEADFDLVEEGLGDLSADGDAILTCEVAVLVVGFDVHGISVEGGVEVVLGDEEAIDDRRDGVFEEDTSVEVLDIVVIVAGEGDLLEDDPGVFVADREADLFGAFDDLGVFEVVE